MVEGESGILAVCPPWDRPVYQPSRCQLRWKNGTIATTYSAEECERLRGPQHHAAWCDEVGTWKGTQTWTNLLLGLRLGPDPRVCLTTTPRTTSLLKDLIAAKTTVTTRGTTLENELHLSPEFIRQIVTQYQGSRLGEQELEGRMVEYSDAQWFTMFRRDRHVASVEFNPLFPVYLAVDCGVSRWTGAILYQWIPADRESVRMHVLADFISCDKLSEENAREILRLIGQHTFGCVTLEACLLDPASGARTGVGPSAEAEYVTVFGRRVRRWPLRPVVDSLDAVETLLGPEDRSPDIVINPRCETLIGAFFGYERATRNGEFLDQPRDPNHPHEELIDALRGAVADRFPEGRRPQPRFTRVKPGRIF
jgi:hypothetical protein